MPLVIISGYPVCGKSAFARQLADALEAAGRTTIIINEEYLHQNKRTMYQDAAHEKILREALRSAVNHQLNDDSVVIVDSLNYIKGYRYELYCISRSQLTPHCAVWCRSDDNLSMQWNQERNADETINDLRLRFEAPTEKNRWDKPLFCVTMGSAESASASSSVPKETPAPAVPKTVFSSSFKSAKKKPAAASPIPSQPVAASAPTGVYFSGSLSGPLVPDVPFESPETTIASILNYLSTAAAPTQNLATVPIRHADAELLYSLDKTSQRLMTTIINHMSSQPLGTPLHLPEYDREITLDRVISASEMQRHRRQFVKMNSQHPPSTAIDVGRCYIDFLLTQVAE